MKILEYLNLNFDKFDYIGYSCYSAYNTTASIYRHSTLCPKLESKVSNILKTINGKYIAVHISRTDHIKLARLNNKYTPDSEFINFIDKHADHKLYIATDNRQTQDKFIQLYKKRIPYIKPIRIRNKHKRKTSLEDAIIDIYMFARWLTTLWVQDGHPFLI